MTAEELAEAIDAVPSGYGDDEIQRGCYMTALQGISDSQLHKLLDAVCEEGLRRGWSSWWWE